MGTFGYILCPHLKGSTDGSVCVITSKFIKEMEELNIRLCMSRHHEACSIYMQSLQNMIEHGSYSLTATAELDK
jgi:hypothetical protein